MHPDDRGLLGMRWQGSVCLDAALPFGLRSAPKIFSAVADALLWITFRNGITWGIHYLDDFLFCGTPDSNECARNLDVALYTCKVLGVPEATNKLEAPTTSLTYVPWHRNRYSQGSAPSPCRQARPPQGYAG